MKSKLLVLTLAPAMLIAAAHLAADDATAAPGKKAPANHQEEMLARFDKDGDGKLDETERAAAREARQKRAGGQLTDEQRASMRAQFEAVAAKHDADGDGKLSAEERKAAREAFAAEHPEAAAKMRAAVDKDGDGTISQKEKRAAAHEMRKKRKGAGGESDGTGE